MQRGKIAVVTGASGRMGEAICQRLLAEGYRVLGADLKAAEPADGWSILEADLSDRDSVAAFTARVGEVVGDDGIDAILNVAGVFRDNDLDDLDLEAWDYTLAVNLSAPLMVVSQLGSRMNPGGAIVNVASIGAYVGTRVGFAYAASKAALISLTMSQSVHFAPRGIRVNAIAPGWTGTGMDAPELLLDLARAHNPNGRLGTYEEIANAAWFLVSEQSSWIHGHTLVVDGGERVFNPIHTREAELADASS